MPETAPEPSINIGGLRGPDEKFHPIKYDLESELTEHDPSEDYRIFAIKYLDETEKQADGALFEIKPNAACPIMSITKEGYKARRQVAEGSGRLLAILPSGEIRVFEVDSQSGTVFEEGKGWVDCWIAGPNGLKILDSSSPAFQVEFEDSVPINNPSLPPEYWQKYHEILGK